MERLEQKKCIEAEKGNRKKKKNKKVCKIQSQGYFLGHLVGDSSEGVTFCERLPWCPGFEFHREVRVEHFWGERMVEDFACSNTCIYIYIYIDVCIIILIKKIYIYIFTDIHTYDLCMYIYKGFTLSHAV